MIKNLGESVGSRVFETVGRVFGRAQEQRPLPVDLFESDDEFLAVFDAPGAQPADVQAKYEDDAIVVRVDRFRDFYDGFEMQFPGRGLTLDGRVELPPDSAVDPNDASATLRDDGTLHVRVPKRPPAESDESGESVSGSDEETGNDDEKTVSEEDGKTADDGSTDEENSDE